MHPPSVGELLFGETPAQGFFGLSAQVQSSQAVLTPLNGATST
jgi:hypothetical protein